jgi:hypothetical protein
MKQSPFFQKYISGILMFLLFSNIVAAQSDSIPDYHLKYAQAKNPYVHRTKVSLLPFGIGVLSTSNHSGNLNIRFPYQTMDASGTTTSHVFQSSTNHLFSNQSPEIFFGFDLSRPRFVFNFSTGFNTTYKGAFYSIGHGFNLYLGHAGSDLHEKTQTCTWMLRTSLNLTYFSFSSGPLGIIDNTNRTIYVLGSEAKPSFTYSNFPSSLTSYTVDANTLIISYKQNQLGLQPKIALCTNPYKKTYGVQLFASYFIPLFESSGLILGQHNNKYDAAKLLSGSASNNLKNERDVTATYNNHSFHSVPFHANHIFIGIVFVCTFQN